jgi:hypothetical protein
MPDETAKESPLSAAEDEKQDAGHAGLGACGADACGLRGHYERPRRHEGQGVGDVKTLEKNCLGPKRVEWA